MARCGCTPICNCTVKAGTCTTVSGLGTAADPYIVNVTVDGQTVLCQGGKLVAKLNTLDTNTVDLSGDGTVATPLKADVILTPNGNVPDPNALGTGNLIKEIAGPGGGIYVSCEDIQDCVGAAIDVATSDCLNYNDASNTIGISICGEPNGVECAPVGNPACPAGGLLVTPSSDPNDTLSFGTDGKLFAAAAALIPGDCMVFTGAGTQASPFVITPQIAPEPNGVECVPGQGLLVVPSSDPNNHLTFGADQRLYANKCPLVIGASQVLVGNTGPCFEFVGGDDCVTPMKATLRLSDDVCQGLECRADGLYVQIDNAQLPADIQTTVNFGPFGPFNGVNNAPLPGGNVGIVVFGPMCITITNPSTCRPMITTGILGGFADTGRTTGGFRLAFDISGSGNPAGPYFSVSQMGQSNPSPASRFTSNAIWSGDEVTIGPGASRTICFRLVFNSVTPVTNARIFSGQAIVTLVGRWVTD